MSAREELHFSVMQRITKVQFTYNHLRKSKKEYMNMQNSVLTKAIWNYNTCTPKLTMISWAFSWGWFHSNTVSQRWMNEREYEDLATMFEKLNFGH